jgi:hypothetical protein
MQLTKVAALARTATSTAMVPGTDSGAAAMSPTALEETSVCDTETTKPQLVIDLERSTVSSTVSGGVLFF